MVWAGLTVAIKRDRDGRKLYDVSIVEDISARKEAEQCIQYLANHDALTGLPNRTRFSHLLGLACEAARRDRRRFAVLFVDLDRFKIINDTLGHEAGDATLRAAAARLRGCVRASDVVARLGGDEFVVLLQDVGEPSVASKIAANVLKSLAEPINVQGHDCSDQRQHRHLLASRRRSGRSSRAAQRRHGHVPREAVRQERLPPVRERLERVVGRTCGDGDAAARCARARRVRIMLRRATRRRDECQSPPSRRAFAGRTRSLRPWRPKSSPWLLKPAACSCW